MKARRPRSGARLRYGPRQLLALARNPLGRIQLRQMLDWLTWPLLRPAAWLWRRTLLRPVSVVAVTGSFGKTSTARAVAAALALDPGHLSRNFRSHLARALLASRRDAAHLVLEVGISRAGQMRPYARMLRPDIVVLTSIGSEHRSSLGSLERTRDEKAELVVALRRGGVAVANGDDPRTLEAAARHRGHVLTCGFGAACDFRAEAVTLDWPQGTRFVAVTPAGRHEVRLRLFGEHGVRAALAALAVASVRGIPLDAAIARLAGISPAPARLEPMRLASGAWLLRDDRKSARETWDAALDLLAAVPATRRFLVAGDVTEPVGRQTEVYRELGRRAAEVAGRILYIGHGYASFASGARQAGLAREAVLSCADVASVSACLERELAAGDVVLLKGRPNDKLERIALRLTGRTVGCSLRHCNAITVDCESCPMRERGWEGHEAVT